MRTIFVGAEHAIEEPKARREVENAERPFRRVEPRIEHVRVREVSLRALRAVLDGPDPERAALGVEELAEDGIRVEARHAAPDDHAVASDQSSDLTIPDQGEIFEAHASTLASTTCISNDLM